MALTLSSEDQRAFRETLNALLAPPGVGPVPEWELRAGRALKKLLHGDRASFVYHTPSGGRYVSEEYQDDMKNPYIQYYRHKDLGRVRVAQRRMKIFSRAELFADDLRTLYASECFNDFLHPQTIGDSVGMAVHGDGFEPAALFAVHRADFGSPDFSERGPALLAMLYPAFAAGIRNYLMKGVEFSNLDATLNSLSVPAAILHSDGRLLHANLRLRRIFSEQIDEPLLTAELCSMAQDLAGLVVGDLAPVLSRARDCVRDVHLSRSYRLHGALLEHSQRAPLVLVMVMPNDADGADVEWLRTAYRLSRRQAEVALLIARYASNAEIADRLRISAHTAKRHTEQVLLKLGVASRREVAARIGRGP